MGILTLDDYRGYVADLGVPDLTDSMLNQCLNTAQNEITATRLWNFRLVDNVITNGSETLTNLGQIVSATYDGDPGSFTVQAIDKRDLEDRGCDLTDTGTFPIYYYLDGPTTVKSWPLATFTLRYYSNPTEMSDDDDTSILPDEMQMALVYQAGGHAFARVGVLDMSQNYFNLAKQTLDSFDGLYNSGFAANLPFRYPSNEA